MFSFSYTNSDAPYVDLYDPDDNMFCSFVPHSPECDTALMAEVDPTYRSIKFKIPGVAKVSLVFLTLKHVKLFKQDTLKFYFKYLLKFKLI